MQVSSFTSKQNLLKNLSLTTNTEEHTRANRDCLFTMALSTIGKAVGVFPGLSTAHTLCLHTTELDA